MHFQLCKKTKLRGWHFTPFPVRSWVWNFWLGSKSKLPSSNAGWEGNASRNRLWSPFWDFSWETADRWSVSGELRHCLAVANCSIFSDLHLPCLVDLPWWSTSLSECSLKYWDLFYLGLAAEKTRASFLLITLLTAYSLPELSHFWWQVKMLIALG